jgi:hypothetical protein
MTTNDYFIKNIFSLPLLDAMTTLSVYNYTQLVWHSGMYIDMSFFVQQHHCYLMLKLYLINTKKFEDQEEHDNIVGALRGVGRCKQ